MSYGSFPCRLNVGSGRYCSRFCNDSPTLRNDINSTELHPYQRVLAIADGALELFMFEC